MEAQGNWDGIQPGIAFVKPVKGIFLWNIKSTEDMLAKTDESGNKIGEDAFRVSFEVDPIACPDTPGTHGERFNYKPNGFNMKLLMAALNVAADNLPKSWAPERILPGRQVVALFVPEGGNEYTSKKTQQKVKGDLFEILFADEVLDRATKHKIDPNTLAPAVRAYAARGNTAQSKAAPAQNGAAGGVQLTQAQIDAMKAMGVDVSQLQAAQA